MGDATFEHGFGRELLIQMNWIDIARDAGEQDEIRLGRRSGHTDGQIFAIITVDVIGLRKEVHTILISLYELFGP